MVLTHETPRAFLDGVHLFISLNDHWISPEFIRSRSGAPMAFTAESSPDAAGVGSVVVLNALIVSL